MAAGTSNFITDADLHGLVDGHLEPSRRADALRRLASSSSDRTRVESWQIQNDLLRSAFAGVDREPLPAMLDLKAKPKLQCVAAHDAPLAGVGAAMSRPAPRRHRFGTMVVTLLVGLAGIGATWQVLDSVDPDDTTASIPSQESLDATLAKRSVSAVTEAAAPGQRGADDKLPATEIPDLRSSGFGFVGAEVQAGKPTSVRFRYENGRERVVLSVARANLSNAAIPVRFGNSYAWRKGDHAFAIAGTLRPAGLRAIALTLQSTEPSDK